jgi:deazaflavin-dependent oxidoreductase (nitroreductase family)
MATPNIRILIRVISALNVFLYRLTGGRISGRLAGVPVLLLGTVGRKSGKPRTMPLMYLADGERWVVVRSNAGDRRHPAWLLNLRRHPEGDVQVGAERRRVRAEEADAETKRQLWQRLVAMYPAYDVYKRRTDREIPVVILHPA